MYKEYYIWKQYMLNLIISVTHKKHYMKIDSEETARTNYRLKAITECERALEGVEK